MSEPVVICGGGLSGLTAAVTALQAGAQVTLIEKAPCLGGTTLLSGGVVWSFDEYAAMRRHIPNGDPALQWLVHENLPEARQWLAGLGIAFRDSGDMFGVGRGYEMDPAGAIQTLHENFCRLGGRLQLETGLQSLVMREGTVTGVRALYNGRIFELPAAAVIIATGGFQGNPELLARYAIRDPDHLILRANPWSTGDGYIAATEAGAAASGGLDAFYGHALAAPPARFLPSQFREVTQYHGRLCVAINMNGDRFTDESEGLGEEVLNLQLARQPGGLGFYIMDEAHMGLMSTLTRGALIRVILERSKKLGAVVLEAGTLESLCGAMTRHGVPAGHALETLTNFNASLASDNADALYPPRKDHRRPLTQPPFRAILVKASITFTTGGLAIDERTRVLWRSGGTSPLAPLPTERAYVEQGPAAQGLPIRIGNHYRQSPIRGLYAAGNDAGNISHRAYMGGLSAAIVTGREAGRNAAGLA